MRSPWVSPILGFLMWQGSGYMAATLFMPLVQVIGALSSSDGHAPMPQPAAWGVTLSVGLCGIALSLLGLILAVRHLRVGTKPRWASVVGLMFGLINVFQWSALMFVAPKFAVLFKDLSQAG